MEMIRGRERDRRLKYVVRLSTEERERLSEFIRSGKRSAARVVLPAPPFWVMRAMVRMIRTIA